MIITFGGTLVLIGGNQVDFGTVGPVGAGAGVETGADTSAAAGFYSPTNALHQYSINLLTFIRFTTDSIGSQLIGTPSQGDKFLLPTTYLDGATTQPIIWELDSNGNTTGRILSMGGSGDSSGLPYKYWNGTTWLSGTFGTQGSSLSLAGSGAAVEPSPDTVSSTGGPVIGGSGSGIETGADSASGVGGVIVAGSGSSAESAPDTVGSTGGVAISGTGASVEPATDSVSSSGSPVITGQGAAVDGVDHATGSGGIVGSGSGAATEAPDTVAATGSVFIPGSGAAVEIGQDTVAGIGAVLISGLGATQEPWSDSTDSTGAVDIAGTGSTTEFASDAVASTGQVTGSTLVIAGSGDATEASPDTIRSTGVVSSSAPPPPPISQNPSTSWVAQFRANYPEFSSSTDYPASQIQYWQDFAYTMLNPARWGRQLDVAAALYVAHNIVLEARAMKESKNGGLPGQQVGILQSKSVDKASASYDITTGTEVGGGAWNLTIYGTRLYRLIKMFGAGGLQIAGHSRPSVSGWPGAKYKPWFY